jgi:hypothetical protein
VIDTYRTRYKMSKVISQTSVNAWTSCVQYLQQNSDFSSCQVFPGNKKDTHTYFVVKQQSGIFQYTLQNGKLVSSHKI